MFQRVVAESTNDAAGDRRTRRDGERIVGAAAGQIVDGGEAACFARQRSGVRARDIKIIAIVVADQRIGSAAPGDRAAQRTGIRKGKRIGAGPAGQGFDVGKHHGTRPAQIPGVRARDVERVIGVRADKRIGPGLSAAVDRIQAAAGPCHERDRVVAGLTVDRHRRILRGEARVQSGDRERTGVRTHVDGQRVRRIGEGRCLECRRAGGAAQPRRVVRQVAVVFQRAGIGSARQIEDDVLDGADVQQHRLQARVRDKAAVEIHRPIAGIGERLDEVGEAAVANGQRIAVGRRRVGIAVEEQAAGRNRVAAGKVDRQLIVTRLPVDRQRSQIGDRRVQHRGRTDLGHHVRADAFNRNRVVAQRKLVRLDDRRLVVGQDHGICLIIDLQRRAVDKDRIAVQQRVAGRRVDERAGQRAGTGHDREAVAGGRGEAERCGQRRTAQGHGAVGTQLIVAAPHRRAVQFDGERRTRRERHRAGHEVAGAGCSRRDRAAGADVHRPGNRSRAPQCRTTGDADCTAAGQRTGDEQRSRLHTRRAGVSVRAGQSQSARSGFCNLERAATVLQNAAERARPVIDANHQEGRSAVVLDRTAAGQAEDVFADATQVEGGSGSDRHRTVIRNVVGTGDRRDRPGVDVRRARVSVRARQSKPTRAQLLQVAAARDEASNCLIVGIADLQQRVAVDVDGVAASTRHRRDRHRLCGVRTGDVQGVRSVEADGLVIRASVNDDRAAGRHRRLRSGDRREGIDAEDSELAARHAQVGIGDRGAIAAGEVVIDIDNHRRARFDQHHVIAVATVVKDLEAVAIDRHGGGAFGFAREDSRGVRRVGPIIVDDREQLAGARVEVAGCP